MDAANGLVREPQNGVTVVIPTYNCSNFIAETISSILDQTTRVDEIVIADDCSNDGTISLIKELAESSEIPVRISLGKSNSGGPATPINRGVAAARNEYVTILDHDDIMEPEKIGLQKKALEEHPSCGLTICDYQHFDTHGIRDNSSARDLFPVGHSSLRIHSAAQRVSALEATTAFIQTPGLPRSSSGQMFRRSHFYSVGGYRPKMGPTSDFDFVMRSLKRGIVWIDKSLYRKRVHADNLWSDSSANTAKNIRVQWSAVHEARLLPFDPITCIVRSRHQALLQDLKEAGLPLARILGLLELTRRDLIPRAKGRIRRALPGAQRD